MHQTCDLVLVLAAHRDYIPPVTHGNDGFLEEFLRAAALDELVKLLADIHTLADYPLSDGGKLRACRVGHLLLGDYALGDALLKLLYRVQLPEVLSEGAFHAFALAEPVAEHIRFAQNVRNVEKFPEGQRRAALAAPQRHAEILYFAEPRSSELRAQLERVVGLFQLRAYLLLVEGWLELQRFLAAGVAVGLLREKI